MQGLPCFCLHSQRRKSVNSIRSATQISPLPSFRRKGSGAAKSHSPIAQRALAAGDLSTQSFMSAPSPDHPYRRVPPLEMTIAAGSIHPFQRGDKWQERFPSPVISTKAERRNLTLQWCRKHDGRRSLGSAFHECPKP